MSLTVRRVVTGHDESGKAIVKIDEIAGNVRETRAGAHASVIWTTDGFPVDNDGFEDPSNKSISTTVPNGTVFRVLQLNPGVAPRRHRTDSIDYAVVMSGEVDMVLDGETVRLRAGDVMVQRGTVHDWINTGTEPCVIAFVLVSARPVIVDGKTLPAHG